MNESSTGKRYWPIVVLFLVTAAALAACLLFVGYLYLPKLVTQRLPVAQIQRLGFADFTGRINTIGLFQTVAGPFVFGHADQPAIAIDSIVIDYTPAELRRKKIRSIRLSGVTVSGVLGPDGFALPGLDLAGQAGKAPADKPPSAASSPLADMAVDKIEIRSGMVNLTWGNATYKIPFETDIGPDGPDMMKLDGQVRLFPRDQRMVVAAKVDIAKQRAGVSLDGRAVVLERFADLIHRIPGLNATGNATIQSNAVLTWPPFAISDATIDLTWGSGRLAYASAVVEPEPDGTPATLSAVSKDLETWQVRAGGVRLRTPIPVAMNTLKATLNLGQDRRSVAGETELAVLPCAFERPTPVLLKARVTVPLTFDFSHQTSDAWTAELRTHANHSRTRTDPLDFGIGGVSVHGGVPRLSLAAKGDGQTGTADWQLETDKIRATAAGAIVNLPSADAGGGLQFRHDSLGPVWIGDVRIQLPAPTFQGKKVAGNLDALTLSARFEKHGSDAPVVDARLRCANGRMNHPSSGLRFSGGRLDLPFRSDPKATASHGTFSVARIDHHKRALGKVRGRITQTESAYAFTAIHDSDLFAGMTAVLAGTVTTDGPHFADAEFTFQIPAHELPAESDLGRFAPAAKGVTLSGTVSARGKASISSKGVSGDVDVVMKDGELRMTEKQISVAGIDATLHFPELPRIRSGPAQPIRFARAAMGGIVVDGGMFDVQVESADTLFIEKGRIQWCGGKLDSQALRITAGKQEYNVSLYCQRLELSRILEQLGSVNARGNGTLNGRIPIAFSNGRIRFDDGFLFSTPGEGGQIQLTGTEILTRGIPAGTPQFAQVELAQAALKDYSYKWAKLGLVSEDEDFVMRLELDGKPAHPLPFVYREEIGGFVRVEAGAQGSIFQGIGLDVNLRLPLNQLLQYKDIVNMIE